MAGAVDAGALKAMLHDGGEVAILDVREAGQFGVDHMLHAVPCPYSVLEPRAAALVPRRGARTVLVDGGDGVAGRAAARMSELGYTDVSTLAGGNPAWRRAGHERFEGVNVPSKAFGEVVELARGTPHVTADGLRAMMDRGEDLVVLDGRTPEEHRRMSIPGGVSVPNAELLLRVHDLAPTPSTTIVVNCAGRTRSIIGAQSLIDAGVPNPVAALKGGTMGWTLAGHGLERGSARSHAGGVSDAGRAAAGRYGDALLGRSGAPRIDAATLDAWRDDPARTLFLLDVRPEGEYLAGHLPGAVSAPGGQLVQATDHWCGVWGARLVVFDTPPGARAAFAAHWLRQMGWDVHALIDGPGAVTGAAADADGPPPAGGGVDTVSPEGLAAAVAAGGVFLVDAGPSMDHRAGRIPTATWAIRPRLDRLAVPEGRAVVVYSGVETRARLVARDLSATREVAVLAGGRSAWAAEGRPLEESPGVPGDGDAIDFLFWTSTRHQDDRQAALAYLEWEERLPAQVRADGDARFTLP